MRVFQDRLVDTADKTYLQRLLHTLLKSRFDIKLSYEVSNTAPCGLSVTKISQYM